MPLIVEDGTMPPAANSYVTLDEAEAWCVGRGLWEATPGTDTGEIAQGKERALIRAFDALNLLPWVGSAPDIERTVAWPRVAARPAGGTADYPADAVPQAVRQAQIELAALIHSGEHDPMQPVERGGQVISHSTSVDVISESTTWRADAPAETYLPAVYGLLRRWLTRVPGENRLVGKAATGYQA